MKKGDKVRLCSVRPANLITLSHPPYLVVPSVTGGFGHLNWQESFDKLLGAEGIYDHTLTEYPDALVVKFPWHNHEGHITVAVHKDWITLMPPACTCDIHALMWGGCKCGSVTNYIPTLE